MNVMVDEPGILTAVQSDPDACAEVWWGKRRAAVRVTLSAAEPEFCASCSRMPGSARADGRAQGGTKSARRHRKPRNGPSEVDTSPGQRCRIGPAHRARRRRGAEKASAVALARAPVVNTTAVKAPAA